MILAVVNSKGGVAKSTTAANTGAALAAMGYKTLLVDLDPQASLTYSLGIAAHELKTTIYDALKGEPAELVTTKGVNILPANLELSEAEFQLSGLPGREFLLKDAIEPIAEKFDFVFIDCPPSLGLLTINALVAASGLLIPLQVEYLALMGIATLTRTQNTVKRRLNKRLEVFGVLPTRYDGRKTLNRDILEAIKNRFGVKVFSTVIRENIALAEAPATGQTIFEYSPKSTGAEDYTNIAKEIIERAAHG
ncbi:MAG: ParA family protein [Calditrichaeota bacterium]|nr:ParA family protein [Calditrichota bacterium]